MFWHSVYDPFNKSQLGEFILTFLQQQMCLNQLTEQIIIIRPVYLFICVWAQLLK